MPCRAVPYRTVPVAALLQIFAVQRLLALSSTLLCQYGEEKQRSRQGKNVVVGVQTKISRRDYHKIRLSAPNKGI